MASPRKKSRQSKRQKKNRLSRVLLVVSSIVLFGAVCGYFYYSASDSADEEPPKPVAEIEHDSELYYGRLIGRWRRPDGGYIIDVRDVNRSGRADVDYYNPRPIHVSKAMASQKGSRVSLFVELQDKGYPGATYELEYFSQQNMLAGIYHQPAAGGSFQVFFVRAD